MDGQQELEAPRSALPAVVNGKHDAEKRQRSRIKRALKGWFGKNQAGEIDPSHPLVEDVQKLKADFVALCNAAEKSERELLTRIADLTETLEALKKREPVARRARRAAADEPIIAENRKRLSGWTVREVQNNIALVEGRNRLVEVSPGQKVRGFGQIKAIERDGTAWVVITTRGVIQSETC